MKEKKLDAGEELPPSGVMKTARMAMAVRKFIGQSQSHRSL